MVVISPLPKGSPSTPDHRYDVFLSFRGSDTRLNFTDHLHRALINAGITTFLDDDEIQTGEDLKPELEDAIKASRASIIVLSKNYAYSTWCLDELVLILQQHQHSNHIVIPIFFHVNPTDIRKQRKSFGKAMAKHNQRMEEETNVEEKSRLAQKIEIWKKALTKVSNLKGESAEGWQETKFIEEIVTNFYHRLGVPLRNYLPLLCGMDDSVAFITSWLNDGSVHTVDILTISGMSGIGKTSLARYVHELHCRSFYRSSFIEGVNEKCTQQMYTLLDLQKQLCGDISKPSLIHVHDIVKYTPVVENALTYQKVFVVLDDIDTLNQMDALLGKKGFHPGSKIIITTKDVSLTEKYALNNSIVQPKHTKHHLVGLGGKASLQLLSIHAFKGNHPMVGYERVSEKLTAYCQGHPLALKVLGESLHERDVVEWEECIEGLKETPDSDIQRVLQMSFDSMPSNNDKELFKHIACFFVGKEKESTETILKACGIRTLTGITNLINRCLLTIGPWDDFQMHQLLQEMGRDLVRQESPEKPWKRSRLWCHVDSFNVLEKNVGSRKVKALVLDVKMLKKENICGAVELKTNALSKMDNLILLKLNYVQLSGSYENFPQKLRWLCMHGSSLKTIPLDLKLENLVALDLSYSNLEYFDLSYYNSKYFDLSNYNNLENFDMSYGLLPKFGKRRKLRGSCSKNDNKLLGSLKILNLSFCKQLHRVGGFFESPALESLILRNCTSLIEVCESIEHCVELVHIDLRHCKMFKKLPRTMVNLKKVEKLLLDGCNHCEWTNDMKSDWFIHEAYYNIHLSSFVSTILKTIPRVLEPSFFIPISLVRLSLNFCKLTNASFPMDFNCLFTLKFLNLDGNPILSLPGCVRNLCKLETLSMSKCNILKSVVHPPCTLRELSLFSLEHLQAIVFVQEMSPLNLRLDLHSYTYSPLVIEGIVDIQPMTCVKEEVVHSLGWTNLEFIKNQKLQTQLMTKGTQISQVQMCFEFGIFSTFYWGKEILSWVKERSNGPSISFTVPSSSKNLRGFNFCYVKTFQVQHKFVSLPVIRVHNITKNYTWIYHHYIKEVRANEEYLTSLSHWMFGKNEMEDGDQVTISILGPESNSNDDVIRECGVSFVYDEDDGKMKEEEDVLCYYKSWNYIIGGDLSAFQTTTPREYLLDNKWSIGLFPFKAFSIGKPNVQILKEQKEKIEHGQEQDKQEMQEQIEKIEEAHKQEKRFFTPSSMSSEAIERFEQEKQEQIERIKQAWPAHQAEMQKHIERIEKEVYAETIGSDRVLFRAFSKPEEQILKEYIERIKQGEEQVMQKHLERLAQLHEKVMQQAKELCLGFIPFFLDRNTRVGRHMLGEEFLEIKMCEKAYEQTLKSIIQVWPAKQTEMQNQIERIEQLWQRLHGDNKGPERVVSQGKPNVAVEEQILKEHIERIKKQRVEEMQVQIQKIKQHYVHVIAEQFCQRWQANSQETEKDKQASPEGLLESIVQACLVWIQEDKRCEQEMQKKIVRIIQTEETKMQRFIEIIERVLHKERIMI